MDNEAVVWGEGCMVTVEARGEVCINALLSDRVEENQRRRKGWWLEGEEGRTE